MYFHMVSFVWPLTVDVMCTIFFKPAVKKRMRFSPTEDFAHFALMESGAPTLVCELSVLNTQSDLGHCSENGEDHTQLHTLRVFSDIATVKWFLLDYCSLFTGLRGLHLENEDIILLPGSNGKHFTLNIQNSPLKEKFYNFTFQQNQV